MKSLSRRRLVAGLTALAVLALAYSQYWVITGRFATVEPGRLYRSAGLSPDALLDICRRHGIRTVVDLRMTSEGTRAEQGVVSGAGLAYIGIPTDQVPEADAIRRFLQVMDDSRHDPVLLHCTHGVGRTGVFSAIFRMEYQRWSPRRATLEAMWYSGFGSFFPGSDKAVFLTAYAPRPRP